MIQETQKIDHTGWIKKSDVLKVSGISAHILTRINVAMVRVLGAAQAENYFESTRTGLYNPEYLPVINDLLQINASSRWGTSKWEGCVTEWAKSNDIPMDGVAPRFSR